MAKILPAVRALQDKLLVSRVKAGNKEAYGKLYDRYFKAIYTFIYLKVPTREVAEDLAAEVFLKVWRYIKEGSHVDNVRALLYRSARNSTIDYYRKMKEISLENIRDNLSSDAPHLDEVVAASDEMRTIVAALDTLKEEYREVVVLRYLQDLSYKEIALILKKKSGTVRILAHRAIKQLKKRIEDQRSTIPES